MTAAPRLLFVGLDAASPDLIEPWIDAGLLPTLARLRESAIWGRTRNPPAVYTGAVWPSFLTGKSPGRHGCYYEDQLRLGTYQIDRILPQDAGHEPFWSTLARAARCSHGMAAHYDATYLLGDILRRIEGRPKPSSRILLDRARALWRRLPVGVTEKFHRIARHVHELPDSGDRKSRRCFAVPTNANAAGIRINLAGSEPAGGVRPGVERERFEAVLVAEPHALVHPDTGRPLVREVIRSADAFPGERCDALPDLFVRWHRESPIRGAASQKIGVLLREDTGRRTGDHRPEGMFFPRGPVLRPRRLEPSVAVEDFAPTIAGLLGCSLRDVDGAPVPALLGR
jgi:predicted AlkP superfamily phosphohydrolase/phosphomutase